MSHGSDAAVAVFTAAWVPSATTTAATASRQAAASRPARGRPFETGCMKTSVIWDCRSTTLTKPDTRSRIGRLRCPQPAATIFHCWLVLLVLPYWARFAPLPVPPMPSMYMPVARFLMRTLLASVTTDHCWFVLLVPTYWPTAAPLVVRPMPSRYRPVARFLIRT